MTENENKSFSDIGGATNSAPQLPKSLGYNAETNEVLVWKKDTWGNFGQHSNKYTFIITPDELKIKPIWEVIGQLRHENNDSRKNAHRYTYATLSDVLKLENHILKVVFDYASSSKREVSVNYFLVKGKVIELESKSGFKDANGFYDVVELPNGQKIKVYKDKVELG